MTVAGLVFVVVTLLLCCTSILHGAAGSDVVCGGPQDLDHSHCDAIIGVYSAHICDDNSIIDATKQSTPANISITCHAKHVCMYHKVHVVWLINVHGSEGAPTRYSTSDSDLLYEEYGISIQSSCPDFECVSTLMLPTDERLNDTKVLCGAFTEVCPGELQHPPSTVTLITKRLTPPEEPEEPEEPVDPCSDVNSTKSWTTLTICHWRMLASRFIDYVGQDLIFIFTSFRVWLGSCYDVIRLSLLYIYTTLKDWTIYFFNSVFSWFADGYKTVMGWLWYYLDYMWKLVEHTSVTCMEWIAYPLMATSSRLSEWTWSLLYILSLLLLFFIFFLIILHLLLLLQNNTRNFWQSNTSTERFTQVISSTFASAVSVIWWLVNEMFSHVVLYTQKAWRKLTNITHQEDTTEGQSDSPGITDKEGTPPPTDTTLYQPGVTHEEDHPIFVRPKIYHGVVRQTQVHKCFIGNLPPTDIADEPGITHKEGTPLPTDATQDQPGSTHEVISYHEVVQRKQVHKRFYKKGSQK